MRYRWGHGAFPVTGGAIEGIARASQAPLEDGALSLWRAGRYREALTAARSSTFPDRESTMILEARIHLRAFDPSSVLALLIDAPTSFSTLERRFESSMVLALAYGRMGEHEAARYHIDVPQPPVSFQSEWSLARANLAWMRGDAPAAEALLDAGDPGDDPMLRLRYAELRGWISSRHGDPSAQAQIVHEAFARYVDEGMPDVGLAAIQLRTLSALNAELNIPNVDALVRSAHEAIAWTEDLRNEQFHILHALSTSETIRSSWFTALRYAQRAHKLAPSKAWRVMTLLDLAFVRRASAEMHSATADLFEALDLAAEVDWQHTQEEERWALLEAAEMCADIDPLRALKLLRDARDLMSTISPSMGSRHDSRARARVAQASGAVLRALQQPEAALEAYAQAFEIYDAVNYQWRAGMMALRAYELSGLRNWLEAAEQRIRHYPESWMAKELAVCRRDRSDVVFQGLSRRHRQVCELLCEGYRAKSISDQLQISIATARAHTLAVYRAYGVTSQADLFRLRGR